MTFSAQRNDITPMKTLITPMMILLSLLSAFATFQRRRAWQFSRAHSISERTTGAELVAMTRKHLLMFLCFCISGISFFASLFSCRSFPVGVHISTAPFTPFCFVPFIPTFFCGSFAVFTTHILGTFLLAMFCQAIFSTMLPRVGLTLFCLLVSCIAIMLAGFAPASKTIFAASILTKLRQWFRGLAFRAGLCYDVLSHFNLPKRLFWLEPVLAGYIPAPGSFYYSRAWRQVK